MYIQLPLHFHIRIMSLRGEGFGPYNINSSTFFIEGHVTSQKSEWSCICFRDIHFACFYDFEGMIFFVFHFFTTSQRHEVIQKKLYNYNCVKFVKLLFCVKLKICIPFRPSTLKLFSIQYLFNS